jgi:O-antigen/teichoic acid export membrane protein
MTGLRETTLTDLTDNILNSKNSGRLTRLGPFFNRLWQRAEVDRAVVFVLLTRGWQLLTGPITLLLVAQYFTPEVQGFYYTFASLLALQSFVELGFHLVIINVTSHEWAFLGLDETGRLTGDQGARSRLISLGRLIFKWYAVASLVFIIAVSLIGYLFFAQTPHPGINWQVPWLALVLLTGLLLWTLPFNSLLEGCNQVAKVNQFRFIQVVLGILALWLTIILGGGLWAAVAMAAVKLLSDLYLLLIQYRRFFEPFFKLPLSSGMHWQTEIWPMQWRLALSGMVNYFAYSLFNPVMFYYYSPAVAGQMGMTWQLTQVLQQIALAWVYTKAPRFGILIAHRDYAELDRFWLRVSLVSLAIISAGAMVIWLLVYGLNFFQISLAQRLLPPLPTGLFLLAAVFFQVAQCQTAYLRAHKQEPIMVMSVVTSLMIGLLVWLLGSRFGPLGAAAGYLSTVLLIVIWETVIWVRCRAAWRSL